MSRGGRINRTCAHDKLVKGSLTKHLIITANCSIHYCLIGEPHEGLWYDSRECCHMSQICVTRLLRKLLLHDNTKKKNIEAQSENNSKKSLVKRGNVMPGSNIKNTPTSMLVMTEKLQRCADSGSHQMAFFMNMRNADEQATKLFQKPGKNKSLKQLERTVEWILDLRCQFVGCSSIE